MSNTENLIRLTAFAVYLHESHSLQLSERHWGTRAAGVPGQPTRSARLAAEPKPEGRITVTEVTLLMDKAHKP